MITVAVNSNTFILLYSGHLETLFHESHDLLRSYLTRGEMIKVILLCIPYLVNHSPG